MSETANFIEVEEAEDNREEKYKVLIGNIQGQSRMYYTDSLKLDI